jgi:hypothetical protein
MEEVVVEANKKRIRIKNERRKKKERKKKEREIACLPKYC